MHSLNLNVQLLLTPNLKIFAWSFSPSKATAVNIQKQWLGGVYKIGVPKIFAKCTEKHVLDSLFNKVVGLRPATLLKIDSNTDAFL